MDASSARGEHEVVGSVDDAGPAREYVIADITEDEAWLAIDIAEAPLLPAMR